MYRRIDKLPHRKRLKGDFGQLPIEVPRDRNSSFEPKIVPKGQTRFDGFDDKILSLYARGMTTREIQSHLEEIYQVEVSPSLISSVTDAVSEEVKVGSVHKRLHCEPSSDA
jgi:putative transposase